MTINSRQIAFEALRLIFKRGAYADIALDRCLHGYREIDDRDRHLITELVYGVTRRQRTLDSIAAKFARQPNQKPPLDLSLILHLGIYQLCYLDQIPASAAVDTSVELAKQNKLNGLAGLVNGVLRNVVRSKEKGELFDGIEGLGNLHSFPDWLVDLWVGEFGATDAEKLCMWFNQTPHIDLRVNRLKTSREEVIAAFVDRKIEISALPYLAWGLRLGQGVGAISELPGFSQGWWTVQDASAQLAADLLDPQPDQVAIDACAAPGGKTTHIAELMGDRGTVWACDRSANRLKRLNQNCDRLDLKSIQIRVGDSREFSDFTNQADRVLLDVPCSGLGTLHRHADARWRQTADEPKKLSIAQAEFLNQAAEWVKPGGCIVYSTCTIHPAENEGSIGKFLATHPDWQIEHPKPEHPVSHFATPEGWIKILPHQHDMDGFFLAKLVRSGIGSH